ASPVSHIWFVKGTPSRLGLLLDISPRSLERVLYFAQHIIVSVNEDERQRRLAEINGQMEEEIRLQTSSIQAQIDAAREAVDGAVEELEAERKRQLAAIESEYEAAVSALQRDYETLGSDLIARIGQASTGDVTLGDVTVLRQDEAVRPTIADELRK